MALTKPKLALKGNRSGLVIDGHIEGIIAHHEKHLTVGKRGRVEGQIYASSVTVLGRITGEIQSDGTVSLTKGADVEGSIFCPRVLIADGARFTGQVHGQIRGDGLVSLAKGAYVEGSIFCARVLIEDGARFKGKIDMGEAPNTTMLDDPEEGKSVHSGKTRTEAA